MRDPLEEIESGRTVRYDGAPVDFSDHALEQVNDRHLHRLDREFAKHETYALLERATITREPPKWLFKKSGVGSRGDNVRGWLTIESLGLAFPLFAGRGRQRGALIAGSAVTIGRDTVGAEVRTIVGSGSQRERDEGRKL
jgi:hypothetical protein